MTEEEKAEKYLRIGICQGCTFICEANCAYAEPVKLAYLDGLTEGRKETFQKILEEIRKHEGIEPLVKYNISEIIKGLEEKS